MFEEGGMKPKQVSKKVIIFKVNWCRFCGEGIARVVLTVLTLLPFMRSQINEYVVSMQYAGCQH